MTEQRGKGRPTELTPLIEAEIIDAVRRGNYISTAAARVGVPRRCIYDWIKRGEEGEEPYASFFAHLESAKAEAEMDSVENIRKAGRESWQADAWYLERTNFEKWGKKEKLFAEVNSSHTERVEAVIEHQIENDEQSRELLKQLYERQQIAEVDYERKS